MTEKPVEMPDEIWVKEFTSDDNQMVLEALYIEAGNYKPYVRKDLAPTSQWRDITEPLQYGNYIVTNNPHSRLAGGEMSHCWHTNMVHWDKDQKEFVCLLHNMMKVHALKMYMVVPFPAPPTKDLADAGKEGV